MQKNQENFTLSDSAIRQRRFVETRQNLGYKRVSTWLSLSHQKQLFALQERTAFNQQDTLAFCLEFCAKYLVLQPIHQPLDKCYSFKIFGWHIVFRKKYEE